MTQNTHLGIRPDTSSSHEKTVTQFHISNESHQSSSNFVIWLAAFSMKVPVTRMVSTWCAQVTRHIHYVVRQTQSWLGYSSGEVEVEILKSSRRERLELRTPMLLASGGVVRTAFAGKSRNLNLVSNVLDWKIVIYTGMNVAYYQAIWPANWSREVSEYIWSPRSWYNASLMIQQPKTQIES